MFQWTEKFEPKQDWVTLIIILIFALCVHLLKINPHQFKLLVSFWRTNTYFKIYDKEKYDELQFASGIKRSIPQDCIAYETLNDFSIISDLDFSLL